MQYYMALEIRLEINFPNIFLDRSTLYRITIVNRNVPSIIGKVTAVIAEANLNISEMLNKSRDDMAYTIIDLDDSVDQTVIDKILLIDGVVRVRQLPAVA